MHHYFCKINGSIITIYRQHEVIIQKYDYKTVFGFLAEGSIHEYIFKLQFFEKKEK